MARPLKDGVPYFPLDTDFLQDDKIRLIKGEFGSKGVLIWLALTSEIYRGNGYFKVWDNDCCILMADAVGCGIVPENISQVVHGCLRRSLFNEGVFQMFGILTSAGIQRRYVRMFPNRRQIMIYREYWLLDENDEKDVPTGILNKLAFKSLKNNGNDDKNIGNPHKNIFKPTNKSKVNQIKEKENKEHMPGAASASPDRCLFIPIILNDGSDFPVYQDQVNKWTALYPAVDVGQELRKMSGWCEANPQKRKTKRGILNFINSWLSREQDRGGTRNGNAADRRAGDSAPEASGRESLGTVV